MQAILYWILALTGSQCNVLSSDVGLACLGLRMNYLGSMILYALKCIQFIIKETSK